LQCPVCLKTFPTGTVLCPNDGTKLTLENLANTAPSAGTLITPEKTLPGSHFGPGTKLGEYTIEEKLGEGGMGQVWKGRHPHIGKRVAIKILSERLARDHKTLARFMNEAKAVNEIQHRNIVDIFSFGELPDGRPYFVMELLQGKPLSTFLQEKGPLSLRVTLTLMEQICRALQAAHDQQIIHRDLKPDNIFLMMEDGTTPFVKLLDFGIAKLTGETGPDGARLTATGTVMGTASYMSPEQAEGKETDQRADVYSLGIILFEMLTGRTPFYEPGDGVGSIISKHIYLPAPAPSSMVSGRNIPPAVDALVSKMLAKKPQDRIDKCLQLYQDLVQAVGDIKEEDSAVFAKPLFGAGSAGQISDQIIKQTPPPMAPKTGSIEIVPASKKGATIIAVTLIALVVGGYAIYTTGKKSAQKRVGGAPELAASVVHAKLKEMQQSNELQPCYDREAEKDPNTPAQLSMDIRVDQSGSIIMAEPSGTPPEGLVSCVRSHITAVSFIKNANGVSLTHDFIFTPKDIEPTTQKVEPTPPTDEMITAFINCEQEGAAVLVDGVTQGLTTKGALLEVSIPKQKKQVKIRFEKEGFEATERLFAPVSDQNLDCELKKVTGIPGIKKTNPVNNTNNNQNKNGGVLDPTALPNLLKKEGN
jgi:serine/threonine protein kinase